MQKEQINFACNPQFDRLVCLLKKTLNVFLLNAHRLLSRYMHVKEIGVVGV